MVAIDAVRGMAATAGATPGNGGHRAPGFGGIGERARRGERRPGPEGPSERKDPAPEGGYGPPREPRKLGTTCEAGKNSNWVRGRQGQPSSRSALVSRSLGLAVAVRERRIEDHTPIEVFTVNSDLLIETAVRTPTAWPPETAGRVRGRRRSSSAPFGPPVQHQTIVTSDTCGTLFCSP
jgi:hypothetical protein